MSQEGDISSVSPLLNEPVVHREYASGVSSTPSQSDDDDFGELVDDATEELEVETFDDAPTQDAPEFDFDTGGGGDFPPNEFDQPSQTFDDDDDFDTGGGGVGLDDGGSDMSAEFVTTLFESYVPQGFHHFSKINEPKIQLAQMRGILSEGSLDKVIEINKNNLDALKPDKEQMKNFKKSLKEVLKSKNIRMSPESSLIFTVIIILSSMFMKMSEIKKANSELTEELLGLNKQ
jgi:hypothetical protein